MYSRLVYMPLEYEIVKRLKELERLDDGTRAAVSAVGGEINGENSDSEAQKGYFASDA